MCTLVINAGAVMPPNMTTAVTPMAVIVRAAFSAFGFRNAGTRFEIASAPVSAVQRRRTTAAPPGLDRPIRTIGVLVRRGTARASLCGPGPCGPVDVGTEKFLSRRPMIVVGNGEVAAQTGIFFRSLPVRPLRDSNSHALTWVNADCQAATLPLYRPLTWDFLVPPVRFELTLDGF